MLASQTCQDTTQTVRSLELQTYTDAWEKYAFLTGGRNLIAVFLLRKIGCDAMPLYAEIQIVEEGVIDCISYESAATAWAIDSTWLDCKNLCTNSANSMTIAAKKAKMQESFESLTAGTEKEPFGGNGKAKHVFWFFDGRKYPICDTDTTHTVAQKEHIRLFACGGIQAGEEWGPAFSKTKARTHARTHARAHAHSPARMHDLCCDTCTAMCQAMIVYDRL